MYMKRTRKESRMKMLARVGKHTSNRGDGVMKKMGLKALALALALNAGISTVAAVSVHDINAMIVLASENDHKKLHEELNDAANEIGSCDASEVIAILTSLKEMALMAELAKRNAQASLIDQETVTMIDQMIPQIISNINENFETNKKIQALCIEIAKSLALVF